jgi:hypothetical protein
VPEFVGPCFLPELSPPLAPSAVFSPLVNTNVLREGMDEADENAERGDECHPRYRLPAMEAGVFDMELRVWRALRRGVWGEWMLFGGSDPSCPDERAFSFLKVSLPGFMNMSMSTCVMDTHITQRRVRCAGGCGEHRVCQYFFVASKSEDGGVCPLPEVAHPLAVRRCGICCAACRGNRPRT